MQSDDQSLFEHENSKLGMRKHTWSLRETGSAVSDAAIISQQEAASQLGEHRRVRLSASRPGILLYLMESDEPWAKLVASHSCSLYLDPAVL